MGTLGTSISILERSEFNYPLFIGDVYAFSKTAGLSMEYISVNHLTRSKNYLATALWKNRIPAVVAMKLCELMKTSLKKYEIKHEAKPSYKNTSKNTSPWECELVVDCEKKVCTMKVIKDGSEYVCGHAYIFEDDDVGICKSISYASHMAYKLAEQKKIGGGL